MENTAKLAATATIESAHRTFRSEITALQALDARLDESFDHAVAMILECQGRIVATGIGKSGHIARKLAATLASTGTPSFFMHGAEAIHGDLGMLTGQDILLAISYSGAGQEILTIVPLVKRLGARLIAITGNPRSELALNADVHLNAHVDQEACPLNLAPTASTTATLVLGDAIAVARLDARGFSSDDFARSHPGGALGRKLLTHVRDILSHGDALPLVSSDTPMADVLLALSNQNLGMTIVVDAWNHPVGIFKDGELRGILVQHGDKLGRSEWRGGVWP